MPVTPEMFDEVSPQKQLEELNQQIEDAVASLDGAKQGELEAQRDSLMAKMNVPEEVKPKLTEAELDAKYLVNPSNNTETNLTELHDGHVETRNKHLRAERDRAIDEKNKADAEIRHSEWLRSPEGKAKTWRKEQESKHISEMAHQMQNVNRDVSNRIREIYNKGYSLDNIITDLRGEGIMHALRDDPTYKKAAEKAADGLISRQNRDFDEALRKFPDDHPRGA